MTKEFTTKPEKQIKTEKAPFEGGQPRVFTRDERIKILTDEIEVQELETKLQKLQAEFFVYRVQMLQATINLDGMTRTPDEKETAEMKAEFEKMKQEEIIKEKPGVYKAQ